MINTYHGIIICNLSKNLSIANGILSKLRYNAPIATCLHVYYATFYSHLTYGCKVWGLTSNKNLNEIEIFQRKCIRIITDSDFRSPTNHLFIRHKILKVREILDLNQLQLAFNFLDKSLPSNLNLFQSNDEIHTYHTRFNFYIPSVDTSIYGINSIKFHCPNLWNKTWVNGITIDNDSKEEYQTQSNSCVSIQTSLEEALFLQLFLAKLINFYFL